MAEDVLTAELVKVRQVLVALLVLSTICVALAVAVLLDVREISMRKYARASKLERKQRRKRGKRSKLKQAHAAPTEFCGVCCGPLPDGCRCLQSGLR